MNIDFFKAAEKDIASLPMLKKTIGILELRQKRLMEKGMPREPQVAAFDKPYVDAASANDTLKELCELAEVTKELEATRREVQIIEETLEGLEEEERRIVVLFYQKGLSAKRIAAKLYIGSEKTVYAIRNKGVARFALLYYGGGVRRT